MPGFMEQLRKGADEVQAQRVNELERKALKTIFGAYELSPDRSFYTNGLPGFHDMYPQFPVKLEAHKVKFELTKAFKDIRVTPIYKLVRQLQTQYVDRFTGVVFQCNSPRKLMLLHDYSSTLRDSQVQMVWDAPEGDHAILVLESLAAFVLGVKESGWSP